MRPSAAAAVILAFVLAPVVTAQLPPVPFPSGNPITPEKSILGKVLFWDAQLSSDNMVACGTCHVPSVGGMDPRLVTHPGFDGVFGTADDAFGSLGVRRALADGTYQPDAFFGFEPQVTRRAANPFIMAAYAPEVFWDGRAGAEFLDPETGAVVLAARGALENQAVGPILSDVEMAHEGRTWDEVKSKLAAVRPLALAASLPPDMAAALAASPSYPDLFSAAFGDDEITAVRIAFAIATYQRTVLPDESPWDLFMQGDPDAMTPQEQAGWTAFESPESRCTDCHKAPVFTDRAFRNIGFRPWVEDAGRMEVTGVFEDRGKFKTPSLRNGGLKPTFMHNGGSTELRDSVDFYVETERHFPENQDEQMKGITLTEQELEDVTAFLQNALTDPRVATEQFPFDRPVLHTDLPPNPRVDGAGETGSGGFVPEIIAETPPNVGNDTFRIGVANALGGAEAHVAWSSSPPDADGRLAPNELFGPITLEGRGDGAGYGTWVWPIPDDDTLRGDDVYLQWRIADPAGAGGIVTTAVARLEFYVSDPTECDCVPDLDCDQQATFSDILQVFGAWGQPGGEEDLDGDGTVTFGDVLVILAAWGPCAGF